MTIPSPTRIKVGAPTTDTNNDDKTNTSRETICLPETPRKKRLRIIVTRLPTPTPLTSITISQQLFNQHPSYPRFINDLAFIVTVMAPIPHSRQKLQQSRANAQRSTLRHLLRRVFPIDPDTALFIGMGLNLTDLEIATPSCYTELLHCEEY